MFEAQRKPLSSASLQRSTPLPALPPAVFSPALQRQAQWGRQLAEQTLRPVRVQRQHSQTVFSALSVQRQADEQLSVQRRALTGQLAALGGAPAPDAQDAAFSAAVQRRAEQRAGPQPLTQKPSTPAQWVQAAQLEVQRMADPAKPAQTRWMSLSERDQHVGTLRTVGQQLAVGFKNDRGPAVQRYAEYGLQLATLQRQTQTSGISRMVMSQLPVSERPTVQRAVDEALQRLATQDEQDQSALQLHALQRQLADLGAQAEQPVMQRIQARRGGGTPLPETVQRQLEAGLNHDFSGVRIHDDSEADTLAKSVQATAFTTGRDIYFQSGKFSPNTQSGLELIAHEVTHVKQQVSGQVGKGIDPDAGLESEARQFGSQFAAGLEHKALPQNKALPQHKALMPSPHAPGVYSQAAAVQRVQAGTVQAALHNPFTSLQRQGDLTLQRNWLTDKAKGAWDATGGKVVNAVEDGAAALAAKGKELLAKGLTIIPGYRELCMTFGKDLVTGQAMAQNPNAILDALAGFVPGPLKDMIRAVKESGAIGKAWAWFQGELGKLQIGSLLGDIGGAIKSADLGKAKSAVMSRVSTLKSIISGCGTRIADIVLTAISAGLGPVGAKIMAGLRRSGDVVVQVLKNPGKFAGNLLSALKQGFGNFGQHAPQHFQNGVAGWLTGATGVTLPPKFDLPGIFMTALTIAGLTYQNFRGRLVKAVGEQKVKLGEGSVQMLQTLKGGLQKDPSMKASQGSVGSEVLAGIKSEVQNSLILAGIRKVVTMLVPGGGFLNAIIGAFQSVQFVIERGAQIASVIMDAFNSVGAIAAGNISGAAGLVERSLSGAIPLALSFVAKLVGIGNLGGKIKNIITKVRSRLDGLVDKMVGKVKGLLAKLGGGKGKTDAKSTKTSPQDVTKRNQTLSDQEKTQKLNVAAKALQGRFQALVKRSPTRVEVKQNLAQWKKEFDLSDLAFDHSAGQAALFAKVNPQAKVGSAYLFDANDASTLRRLTKLVAQNLLAEPKVQQQAQAMRRQDFLLRKKGDYLGSKQSPVQLKSGLALLSQISYWRSFGKSTEQYPVPGRMPPLNAQGKPGRGKNNYYVHSDNPEIVSAAQPQFNPNNEHVKGGGDYLNGKNALVTRIQGIVSRTGFSDRVIAGFILNMIRGEAPIGLKSTEVTTLKSLKQMLFSSESKRSGENIVNAPMLISQVASGEKTWQQALESLPMHPKGAEAAKRELERQDKKLQLPDPGSVAAKIAALEAQVTQEYVKTISTKQGFVVSTLSQVQRLVEREMRKFYGL
ncbi:DUF4157 domain-containing protein [Deinococcus psychrotolerans]|uniref:DUF4157 domain-containing protein n=1 Tax=Deinococcus psychrotolerans TaxID=2489213 RepID=A0A3G8YHH2_9DEIO|nr:DUF4157 domain-containing protein [Deinococcus psychrotolerans]AZI43657.1 DUF4157 domain-containing protein [Deinococcus psychrotolerans]